ncbi:hypothetical protein PEC106568_43990 [Pectobacterium carotovorum subsp. carotovorum]|nr:hypothetical protein PEC106568_43990 [Pectobacterium carotovorum subsp. carotovorum]
MKLGELDETILILMGINAVMWGVNIGLMSLFFIK